MKLSLATSARALVYRLGTAWYATNWRYVALVLAVWIGSVWLIQSLPGDASGPAWALLRVAMYIVLVPLVDNVMFRAFDTERELKAGNVAYSIVLGSTYFGLALLVYAL